jgi:hypothetical protein
VEGATQIPGHGEGKGKAQGAKLALPGAPPEPERTGLCGSGGGREGNPSRFFSMVLATGLVATSCLCAPGDRRGNGSVPGGAGALWSAS